MKKGVLSSKEKEIWTCECGKQNDITDICNCGKNIYGFYPGEVSPQEAIKNINLKTELIKDYLKD